MMTRIYALAIFSVALSALAQTAFKFGMTRASTQHVLDTSLRNQPVHALVDILTNPAVMAGLGLYATSAVLWLFVLARLDLSVAYPMVSLGFILTMLAGALLFGEPVTPVRVAGTLLVCLGVSLIART